MKLPVTDQFLWMVYNFFEKRGEALEIPHIFKVRGWRDALSDKYSREFWKHIEKKKRRKQFDQFIYYLKKKGYIKIDSLKGKKGILLTPKGRQKSLRVKYKLNSELEKEFKKRKDKKWIMVIFDIPEKMKRYRDELRDYLISFGFKQLQKSVWVCPYDVMKRLEEIIAVYSLDKFVRIFLIEEIEI